MAVDPTKWLLTPSPAKDGKPWGTATKMAERAKTAGTDPWDQGCEVKTLIGGYAAMSEMRDALESLIIAAQHSSNPTGQRGHVYIADWRFNCQRDLSSNNPWKTKPWSPIDRATIDQTAIGLILRLMQAGVVVRILVWLPTPIQVMAASLEAHIADHCYLAMIVAEENARLKSVHNPIVPLGIVGLDARAADGAIAGAHHQKMLVIRSPNLNVAFCGGVDLALTRRDAPLDPSNYTHNSVNDGDWQSATKPNLTPAFLPENIIWPPDSTTNYVSAGKVNPPSAKQPSDLPTQTDVKDVCDAMGGKWDKTTNTCTYTTARGDTDKVESIYGFMNQRWHDQHLKLRGPIVESLEWQFTERWIDSTEESNLKFVSYFELALPLVWELRRKLLSRWLPGDVWFSSDEAIDTSTTPKSITSLETPQNEPSVSGATSIVQMWRTIPMRNSRSVGLFHDGEFTVMAGYAKAISAAKELIWIFDQYFWSEPAARLLNYRVRQSEVCVLVILPPYADSTYPEIHRARKFALSELMRGLDTSQRNRIAIYNMWHPSAHDPAKGRGIYVHAKTQTYDGSLLVCGSANLNRRSLTCDSELACAVLDPAVVNTHQKQLWKLLFGNVASPKGDWPNLDLNGTDKGKEFLEKFKSAASSGDAFLIPDPWDDDNPIQTPPKLPKLMVELPNGVPRPEAFQGPKYEIYYDEALDPGSLDPIVENDIMTASMVPRPVRLDEIVYRIEHPFQIIPGAAPAYLYRKQASIVSGQLIKLAGTTYYDGKYNFTETAEWFKQVCIGFPCFLPIGWPGYETAVIDNVTIDGHDVVLQLWKGWCQRFAGIDGMPGGVGAEVGVYRRIPGRLQELLNLPGIEKFLTDKIGGPTATILLAELNNLNDSKVWWPFPELNASVEFTLRNPTTNAVLFNSKPENTYWNCKWMTPEDYNKYAANPTNNAPVNTAIINDVIAAKATIRALSPLPFVNLWDDWFAGFTIETIKLLSSSQYILDYKVTGKTSSYSDTWSWSTGPEQFPKIKI